MVLGPAGPLCFAGEHGGLLVPCLWKEVGEVGQHGECRGRSEERAKKREGAEVEIGPLVQYRH